MKEKTRNRASQEEGDLTLVWESCWRLQASRRALSLGVHARGKRLYWGDRNHHTRVGVQRNRRMRDGGLR